MISAKAARVNAGLSQTQVAEHLHVSKSTVSRWETGVWEPDLRLHQPAGKSEPVIWRARESDRAYKIG